MGLGYINDKIYSGQAFGISTHLPSFFEGSIGVICPACPQPGINMVMDISPKDHVYNIHLAADGNIRQILKAKKFDEKDFALCDGVAYMVANKEYLEYLKSVSPESDKEVSNPLREARSVVLIIRGIIALSCACHTIARPNGIFNMYHGERYSNTDYAAGKTLEQFKETSLPLELNYNVACKYKINIKEHMKFYVPEMHIKVHQESCQKQFK
ncbi:hypothetical protein M422DRAFT_182940 [Sphaerobolus stellatus SS14]|uniref:Unplaced genomic scaffold SPHSTscaffold_134, whole genome shotgun sequence n=1 Tax=Sphaerobolus stellatus (strain SS14) TaxID=990650 RepID=A0A0C9V8E3_SPHS4|nr:hypothetical protein M422DRAFT_182940 [Sphaerobolus stellatus SS14]